MDDLTESLFFLYDRNLHRSLMSTSQVDADCSKRDWSSCTSFYIFPTAMWPSIVSLSLTQQVAQVEKLTTAEVGFNTDPSRMLQDTWSDSPFKSTTNYIFKIIMIMPSLAWFML